MGDREFSPLIHNKGKGPSSDLSLSLGDVEVPPEVLLQQELRAKHDQIIAHPNIPWESFQAGGLISEEDLTLLRKYETQSAEVKRLLFEESGEAYARLFLKIGTTLANRETTQYALTLIDDILQVDESKAEVFLRLARVNPDWPITAIRRILLSNPDTYVTHRVTRILSVFLLKNEKNPENDIQFIFRWLNEQLKKQTLDDVTIAVNALMVLLRRTDFRQIFVEADGINQLAFLLKMQKSTQGIYHTVYCLWLLSYTPFIAARMAETNGVLIPRLVDVLRHVPKEKIQRVILALLRNLLDKGTSNVQMIDAGIMKLLEHFSARKWADDDLVADIEALRDSLAKNVVEMSSFDVYKKEIASGNLDWTPVHRSEKFWRENINKFDDNQYELVKQLVAVLGNSHDPKAISVACFDIGEFVRFHPRGKAVAQATQAKRAVMELMTHADPAVQKEALLAVQKMMVTNWEYLSSR